jgi:trypsin-like peptidase
MIRRILPAVALLVTLTATGEAQQSRADLLRSASSAYDDFQRDRAIDLLKAALNPSLGATDSAWVRGVHLLTQILVEGGNQDLAKAWARWAARLQPEMAVDSVNFVAGAVAVLKEARDFTRARTAGDVVTRTAWRWPARASTETRGRIAIDQGGMPVPVNVRVVGGGIVPAGATGLSLSPGSYEIEAAATGYLPVRFTREILPGVTTSLAFALTSAAVASDVIAENFRQHTFLNSLPLSVRRFGVAPSCAAGAYMTADGLLLTSYQAIRGAEELAVTGAPGIRVAAYDVAGDLAVLKLPTPRTDSIAAASQIAEGQSVWALRYADCRAPSEVLVRVSQWNDRPRGALQLSDAPAGATVGSLLVDVQGRLTGIWTGGTAAAPATRAVALLDQARRNVAQGQLIALTDVARRENHLYGSVIISTDVTGVTAKITPLEQWQWAALQTTGGVPFTFTGPMGRYRLEMTGPADARREQIFTVRPGAQERVIVSFRATVAAGQNVPATVAKRGSKKPWVIAGVGGGAALLAAVALGGGGGGGGTPPPPPPTTGSIRVRVPVNPP